MLERILLALAFAVVVALAISLAKRYAARRTRAVVAGPMDRLWASLGAIALR